MGRPQGKPLDGQHHSFDGSAARRLTAPAGAWKPADAPLRGRDRAAGSRRLSHPVPENRPQELGRQRTATAPPAMTDERFKAELLAVIPHLRAFAYSMMKRGDADDLVQESLLRAWQARASYQPGTNLKGWTFTILRNLHLSNMRRAWRSRPLDPADAEKLLVANDDPFAGEELLDVRNAMQHLPLDQRHALVLVGAAGLSYEETAKICGCAIGTVKSRVSRARETLAAILKKRARAPRVRTAVSSTQVFQEIMQGAANLRRRLESSQRPVLS